MFPAPCLGGVQVLYREQAAALSREDDGLQSAVCFAVKAGYHMVAQDVSIDSITGCKSAPLLTLAG